ncbi:hypothetical protein GQ600_14027 [Phytophthora cactorum]|nr:hypothetical protein GQ600_14027 [Phytophthora cactorum]
MQLPREIHLVPKVTKLISEFAISRKRSCCDQSDRVAHRALTLPELATKWTKQLKSSRKSPQFAVISDVLVAVYEWWDRLSARQKRGVGCGRVHVLALENGNFDAFVQLQSSTVNGMKEGLETALENGQQKVVDTIARICHAPRRSHWVSHSVDWK